MISGNILIPCIKEFPRHYSNRMLSDAPVANGTDIAIVSRIAMQSGRFSEQL
jgi:hypothetical protein